MRDLSSGKGYKNRVPFGSITYDRWVIGKGVDSPTDYIIRLGDQSFTAKYWDGDEDDELRPYTIMSFLAIDLEDCLFYDIVWFCEIPDEDETMALFQEAKEAIKRYKKGLSE